jgi:DNA modification methylase
MMPSCEIIIGNALEKLHELPDRCIQCCVTSPPYYGLRDYGDPMQLGAETTPGLFIKRLVEISGEIRRVLKDDGTFWLNLGDSYYNYRPGGDGLNRSGLQKHTESLPETTFRRSSKFEGIKEKDRMMMPARVAIALSEDGWYLRDEIVWAKPNPMPESVTDRTTKAHEFIYLLTKNKSYYYDQEAIKEPYSPATMPRLNRGVSDHHKNVDGAPGQSPHTMNQPRLHSKYAGQATKDYELGLAQNPSDVKRRVEESILNGNGLANKRSVWTINTAPCRDAHFATYPEDLIKPCILAGSRPGDTVLDPFAGRGTTGLVALELGRSCILIELNPKYASMCEDTINITPGFAL